MKLYVEGASGTLRGEIAVPCSKYHAHRALILASLAPGTSRIAGISDARHVQYTMDVLRALGTRIERDGRTLVVRGGPYRVRRKTVSAGSSGTTLYFMIGLAALADAPVTLTAQKYFRRRPVGPLLDALGALGLQFETADGCPPIAVAPQRPRGGHVAIPGTLSQWISGLLLVAPFARERTVVTVEGELNERPYVELTVEMMRAFGLHVGVSGDWRRFEIEPGQQARATHVELPPDIGSAAFGLAATALHPSDVLFRDLPLAPGQRTDHPEGAFVEIVREMGLPMASDEREGCVRVRHDGFDLRGSRIDCRDIPDMLPILATLGTFARGETILENVEHVRLKESDRVAAMLQLNEMGGDLTVRDGRLVVRGVAALHAARLSSFNDHRILMSLAVAATRARGRSSLTYPNAYRISYPHFLEDLRGIGARMWISDALADASRPAPPARVLLDPDRAATHTLVELLERRAREVPLEPAVIEARDDGDVTLTWQELLERVDRAATLLLHLGVRPGERVAYQLPNCVEFVVLTLAALRAGAVCCPLMPIFREREIAFCLRRSQARVLFVPDEARGRFHAAEIAALINETAMLDGQPPLQLEYVVVCARDGARRALPVPENPRGPVAWLRLHEALEGTMVDERLLDARRGAPGDIAQLLFTSGTSGEPKGVLHRNDVLMRAAAMEIEHLGLRSDDRIFVPSPLAHQTGFLYGMWLALVMGVPQILQPVWNARRGLRALQDWDGTFVQAATPFLADMVEAVDAGAPSPQALRMFVATGAAVPRKLAERATRVLGASVCGAWGTTESCLGSLSAPGDPPESVWGTDGRALHGIELRVVDDAGREQAPGVEGHFEVRSPTMFAGYADRADWTAAAYTPDGWFRTGDLATIDDAGYVRVTGRVRDVINRGGEKVPVAEVEQLLGDHPAVAEVAIVAMPDERLGERACAFAVLRPGGAFDFARMRHYLDACQVAKHYWPERLEVISELPRTPSGKVQKYVLRERAKTLRPQTPAAGGVS